MTDPIEDAIAQAKVYYEKLEATDMAQPVYAFWVVNHYTEQRRQWVEQVRYGLRDYPKFAIIDLAGDHVLPIRGRVGLYCLWHADTAHFYATNEVKAALGLTFVTPTTALKTMLQHHQLFIQVPESEPL